MKVAIHGLCFNFDGLLTIEILKNPQIKTSFYRDFLW